MESDHWTKTQEIVLKYKALSCSQVRKRINLVARGQLGIIRIHLYK